MNKEYREGCLVGSYVAGLAGLVLGIIGTTMVLHFGRRPLINADRLVPFVEEGRPALMRIYSDGRDQILVEAPMPMELKGKEVKKVYVPLYRYLEAIKDPANRATEEARIKKQAEWYK